MTNALLQNDNSDRTVLDIKRVEDATGTVWLTNGVRLMIRTIVTGVRVVHGQQQADGQPIYEVASNTIVISKPAKQ